MIDASRRLMLRGAVFGAAGYATTGYAAGLQDGHAAGADVAPSANFMPVIPRKSSTPLAFTAELDRAPLKATSGGWARDVTTRSLPIATGIAGAHLFINPGGLREMHWHSSAEWAYIIAGQCQIAVVDPSGELEIENYGPGDLWYFPEGHVHAIQALGSEPCHAILAFNDGLYGEHGTFGLTDLVSRLDAPLLRQHLGPSAVWFGGLPPGEAYIMQGALIPTDSPAATATQPLPPARTHRFPMLERKPAVASEAGTLHVASGADFPVSLAMTGMLLRMAPNATQGAHWHPNANEWHYVIKGQTRVTLFGPDKILAVADMGSGDCAYIPRACAHLIQNIGTEDCELVGVLDSGTYQMASLFDWMTKVPAHFLANNLGLAQESVPTFQPTGHILAPI